jgi:hypothetical protein
MARAFSELAAMSATVSAHLCAVASLTESEIRRGFAHARRHAAVLALASSAAAATLVAFSETLLPQ